MSVMTIALTMISTPMMTVTAVVITLTHSDNVHKLPHAIVVRGSVVCTLWHHLDHEEHNTACEEGGEGMI